MPSESDNLDEQSKYEAKRCLRLEKHRRARKPLSTERRLAAFDHNRARHNTFLLCQFPDYSQRSVGSEHDLFLAFETFVFDLQQIVVVCYSVGVSALGARQGLDDNLLLNLHD